MNDNQVGVLLLDIALIVTAALVIQRLASLLGQPAVLGEIIAGILIGPTLLHGSIAHTLFPTDLRAELNGLADVGLVLFMFTVGVELDRERLRGFGRVAGAVAAGASLLPFALGVALALRLAGSHHPAQRLGFLLFLGVVMSITAFPVLSRLLVDRRMDKTLIGSIALSAAAVCDLAAWTGLAIVQVIAGGSAGTWRFLLIVPLAVVLFTVVRPLLSRMFGNDRALTTGRFVTLLAGTLTSAGLTQLIGLHFVFGAFLFGLALPSGLSRSTREELIARVQPAITLLLPIYFIVAGLAVDLSGIGAGGLVNLALILVVAIGGKGIGVLVAARTQGMSARRSVVLATLMNTRGLTELIALSVGLRIGVLDSQLYSLMVVMAIVTTAMAGPLLRWLATGDDHNPPMSGGGEYPCVRNPSPPVDGVVEVPGEARSMADPDW